MDMKTLLPPVVVNDVTIPAEVIAAEAQNHPAPKGKPGHAWKSAARALALRELLLQAAKQAGLKPLPAELAAGQWETPEEALVRQFLEAEVKPEPVTEADLRRHYEADPVRFRSPALYEAAHILFPASPGDTAAREAAHARATSVLAQIQENPRRFTDLAREHSACTSRQNGGLLGQLSSGDTVPEFEMALATMETGTISMSPVETRYGFHLIRLDARAEGAVLPFASVLPHLREAAEKAAWVRASSALTRQLTATAQISGIDFETVVAVA